MSGLKQYINKFRNKHRFFVYNIRWQLGTPIYTVVLAVFLPKFGLLWSTIIANFVGACFFFLPDTLIFNKTNVKKTRQTDLKEFSRKHKTVHFVVCNDMYDRYGNLLKRI